MDNFYNFYQGTKSAYKNRVKDSQSLYFCTDTKELFKGEDLYTDGLRLVEKYSSLPGFDIAAEGKLYICEDTGCGYILNTQGNGWIQVLFGADNESIQVNDNGLLAVKAIPVSSVTGLEERLQAVENNPSQVPVATNKIAGKVKASSEVLVSIDGTMSLGLISQDKIEGLTSDLVAIRQENIGATHYRGSVAKFSDLPKNAILGDMYEVMESSSVLTYNGSKWIGNSSGGGGSSGDLKPIAKADINNSQFKIENDVLSLVSVEASIVKYGGKSLSDALDEVVDSMNWKEF